MSNPTPAPPRIDRDGDLPLHARNATLADLAGMLKDQHARKVDVVAPATAIRSKNGVWVVSGTEPVLTDAGVDTGDGRYTPTTVADEGLAAKLNVPVGYLRRMRAERPDLYDATINGWLHGAGTWSRFTDDYRQAGIRRRIDGEPGPDSRSFLVRCFRGQDGTGVARAFLSDRYRIVDNLDVLTAALDGVREAGADVTVDGCDLTDRRMMVRVVAPGIAAYAPDLLAGYRSPFGGQDVGRGWTPERVAAASRGEGQAIAAGSEPVVFAGFVISNSETGGGAFTITPRLVVKVCNNGLTVTADALRSVHLGGRQDDGLVRWSEDTQRKSLELVTAQARDAVATFLDVDYVRGKVSEIAERAGREVEQPEATVRSVAKALRFDQDTADGILAHFIKGGQTTAGGVMQAVTSYARTVEDGDAAADLEDAALDALTLAAR